MMEDRPPSTITHMKFIKKSYSQKQLIKNLFQFIVFFVLLISFSIITLYWGLKHLDINPISITLIIGIILGVILVYFTKFAYKHFDIFLEKRTEEIRKADLGNKGEKLAFEALRMVFPEKDGFKVFYNYIIPGRKFDIDAVVIGPKGLLTFEVKNPQKKLYFYSSGAGVFDKNHNWRRFFSSDPVKKSYWHSQELLKHLNNVSIPIKSIILVIDATKCRVSDNYNNNVDIICGSDKLEEYVKKLPNNPLFLNEFCKRIETRLTAAY